MVLIGTRQKNYCEERATNLLALNNPFKFDDYEKNFRDEKNKRHLNPAHVKAWLGLKSENGNLFHWEKVDSDSLVDSEFWAKNLPDNGAKVCVGIEASTLTLNNFNCYSLYGFFCEKDYKPDEIKKCGKGLGTHMNTCFEYFYGNEVSTWYGAKQFCEKYSWRLMTIHDRIKFNTVHRYMKSKSASMPISRAWIGAAKILSNDIQWVHNNGEVSQIDSDLWHKKDRPESNKNCAAIDGHLSNKLNNFDCNMKNGYFCEYF